MWFFALASLAALFLVAAPARLLAGPIETACNRSDRPTASAALCRCIDDVAQRVLTGADQRRAARFFRDPDEAQRVRMSSAPEDARFWERYRSFGELAEVLCAPRR